jgi:hypothetical protein
MKRVDDRPLSSITPPIIRFVNPVRPLLDMISLCVVLPLLFALLNVQLLLLYVLPFVPGFARSFAKSIDPFLPFLAIPAILTAVAYVCYLYRSNATGCRRSLSLNALVFATFLVSAELYKNGLILIEAVRMRHECLHIHTFAGSIHRMGEYAPDHAKMIVDGTPYFWSYSELKFVQGKPAPWHGCDGSFFTF